MNPERIVSGSKPSGELHIGNYFGANKSWVELQDRYDCFYFVADYHALTEEWDPVALRTRTLQMALDLLACGIDPERSVFFLQSDVPEHAELTWIFNCLTGFGDLERMTQFKDRKQKLEQTGSFLSVGLFDYPVLQSVKFSYPMGGPNRLTPKPEKHFGLRAGSTCQRTPGPNRLSLS